MVVCSGKIYYELLAHRAPTTSRTSPSSAWSSCIRSGRCLPVPRSTSTRTPEVVWCQEEPRNQGVWYWLASRHHLDSASATSKFLLVSRPAAASPAVGYYAKHNAQQKAVIENAFGEIKPDAQVSAQPKSRREIC